MRVIVYQASDTSALSKNFTRKDFKCPCGCTRQMVDSELVEKLQAIRDKLGKAIKVTSGYRCITHNASKTVGGSPNSKHRYGMAADWRMVFLSTPSARRATRARSCACRCDTISIHALREEGDWRST